MKIINFVKRDETIVKSYLKCVIYKDDEIYCALCLDVNIATEGESINEAKKNLKEAVVEYLDICIEEKIPILRDTGFSEQDVKIIEKFLAEVDFDILDYDKLSDVKAA